MVNEGPGRGRRNRLVAGIVCALSIALLHQPALASTAATLTLSIAAGPPTTSVRVTGSGFGSHERIVLGFDQRTLGITKASGAGAFSAKLKAPATAKPGEHTISAKGQVSGEATASFTVRTNWPTFHFSDARAGENPYENVLSPSNVANLELSWAMNLGDLVMAAPVVVDGVLYAATGQPTTYVYAMDPVTGAVQWRRFVGGNIASNITFADGKLYLSTFAHAMYVLDAATGKVLQTVHGPTNTPAVVDGVIYASDNLNTLWAFDASTYQVLWTAHSTNLGYGFGLAVVDGVVYTGASDRFVYAYDAVTGGEVWNVQTGDEVLSTPAVVDGVVYVGSDDRYMYAIEAATGHVLWKSPTEVGGAIEDTAAVADGTVYASSFDGNMYAFDAVTGDVLWTSPVDGGAVKESPVVANGVLYQGARDSTVYAWDAITGDVLWTYETGGSCFELIVDDGTVYVGSVDHNLYAFRLPGS
jgi:outer membrane protein assembly factor BamB